MTKYWRQDTFQQNFGIVHDGKTYIRVCEFRPDRREYSLEVKNEEYFPPDGMEMNGMFNNVQRQFIMTAFEKKLLEPIEKKSK
jgi:hypothetical protein